MASEIMRVLKLIPRYEYRTGIAVPEPADDEVLIRVFAVGLSHNVYHASRDPHRLRLLEPPFHSPVGTIVRFGPNANINNIFRVGHRVAVVRCRIPCTHCDGCQQAEAVKENYDTRTCEESSCGTGVAGDITQYARAVEYSLVAIPNGLGFNEAAVLVGARAALWDALIRAQLGDEDAVGIYGPGELAVLAAQFAMGRGWATVIIDPDRFGPDMNCRLTPRPPLRVETTDAILGGRIMEYLHNQMCDSLAIIFCAEAKPQTQRTLQLTCQHESIHLPSPETYPYYATRDSRECKVQHALQVPCEDVRHMLLWVQDNGIRCRMTMIDLHEGTTLHEKLAAMDFEGFLVLTM